MSKSNVFEPCQIPENLSHFRLTEELLYDLMLVTSTDVTNSPMNYEHFVVIALYSGTQLNQLHVELLFRMFRTLCYHYVDTTLETTAVHCS